MSYPHLIGTAYYLHSKFNGARPERSLFQFRRAAGLYRERWCIKMVYSHWHTKGNALIEQFLFSNLKWSSTKNSKRWSAAIDQLVHTQFWDLLTSCVFTGTSTNVVANLDLALTHSVWFTNRDFSINICPCCSEYGRSAGIRPLNGLSYQKRHSKCSSSSNFDCLPELLGAALWLRTST